MDANEAARELRRTLQAPSSALSVSVWQQEGKISLMVWIDPRYLTGVTIPNSFEGYRVDIRRKLQIKAGAWMVSKGF
jgi:hypothetical protein